MNNRRVSAIISLVICILSSVLLVVWIFTFPRFFNWFYVVYHDLTNADVIAIQKIVVAAFYGCVPFAGAALACLIKMLLNILRDDTFTKQNVTLIRIISWCCYAVTLITFVAGLRYFPLWIVAFATAVVGTLLRVMKNLLQSAVELKEENELTI